MIQRGIRGDDSSDAVLFAGRKDLLEIGEQEVGGDLYEDRFATGLVLLLNCTEQRVERIVLLQSAKTWRVRRTDVQHNVIGEFAQEPEGVKIIVRCFLDRRDLRFSEVEADRYSRPAATPPQGAQSGRDDLGPVVVETQPIDQRFLRRISENPWLRVSGLSFPRDGADLDKTEPKRCPRRQRDAILVETGSQSDGIWESDAEECSWFRAWLKTVKRAECEGQA